MAIFDNLFGSKDNAEAAERARLYQEYLATKRQQEQMANDLKLQELSQQQLAVGSLPQQDQNDYRLRQGLPNYESPEQKKMKLVQDYVTATKNAGGKLSKEGFEQFSRYGGDILGQPPAQKTVSPIWPRPVNVPQQQGQLVEPIEQKPQARKAIKRDDGSIIVFNPYDISEQPQIYPAGALSPKQEMELLKTGGQAVQAGANPDVVQGVYGGAKGQPQQSSGALGNIVTPEPMVNPLPPQDTGTANDFGGFMGNPPAQQQAPVAPTFAKQEKPMNKYGLAKESLIEQGQDPNATNILAASQPKPSTTLAQKQKMASDLRKEFNSSQIAKDYQVIKRSEKAMGQAYKTSIDPNTKSRVASDQALAVVFQKMLDPTSVVRESEYARTPQGVSLVNRIESFIPKLQKGGLNITDDDRKAIYDMGKQLLEASAANYKEHSKQYSSLAERSGLSPVDVIGEETKTISTKEEYDALPDGTEYIGPDGKPAVKGNKK